MNKTKMKKILRLQKNQQDQPQQQQHNIIRDDNDVGCDWNDADDDDDEEEEAKGSLQLLVSFA